MPHASDAGRKTAVFRELLPIMAVVLIAFLVIGVGLPVLPLHVHGGLGSGVILSFASLLFAERGWQPVWLAFTAYAVALILARLALGHLADRIGGAGVAIACVVVEAVGLGLMGAATSTVVATIGAALVGLGYALGLSGPILGAVAGSAGLGVVFLASAVCVLASVPVTLPLLYRRG